MLSTSEMEKLLLRFPKIELSYDKLIHKKVQSNFYQAIPYGKKYLAWFTWASSSFYILLLILLKSPGAVLISLLMMVRILSSLSC